MDQNSTARLGGALYASESSLLVSDSEFTGNVTTDEGDETTMDLAGGGLMIWGSVFEADNCLFEGNESLSGGGYFSYGSEDAFVDCRFAQNSAILDGGGYAANALSYGRYEACTFEANTAGGWGGGMLTIGDLSAMECSFEDNTASVGAGMFNIDGEVSIADSIFAGNEIVAEDEESPGIEAAAILNVGTDSTISNCTFWGNTSFDSGVGATIVSWMDLEYDQYDDTTIIDSIIWGNGIPALVAIESTPAVTHSDVEGGYPGTGNIDADPLFVDPDAGDFCLQAGSPCIGAGDGGVDMGAPCPE